MAKKATTNRRKDEFDLKVYGMAILDGLEGANNEIERLRDQVGELQKNAGNIQTVASELKTAHEEIGRLRTKCENLTQSINQCQLQHMKDSVPDKIDIAQIKSKIKSELSVRTYVVSIVSGVVAIGVAIILKFLA